MNCEPYKCRAISQENFVCKQCGKDVCYDCGTNPAWWYCMKEIDSHYCRRCASKGGHRYLERVEIDPDLLLAKLGGPGHEDEAESFLDEIRTKW